MVESSRVQHFQRPLRPRSCRCFALTNRSTAVPKPATRASRPRDLRLTTAAAVLPVLRPSVVSRLEVVHHFLSPPEAARGFLLPWPDGRIRSSRKPRRRQEPSGLAGTF